MPVTDPQYETLMIERIQERRPSKTTKIYTCDCCLEEADIIVNFTKRGPNKKKSSGRPAKKIKQIILCNKHAIELSNYIKYFV